MGLRSFAARVRDGIVKLLGFRRQEIMDRRYADEMRFHLEMAAEANVRLGMSPDEARRGPPAAIRRGRLARGS
jgi:hypothetical protein